MRDLLLRSLTVIFCLSTFLFIQKSSGADFHKNFGFGVRFGITQLNADDLTKTDQKTGVIAGFDFHYVAMDAIELILDVSYGLNDVNWFLGEAHVTRIYQFNYTIGFRFYPPQINFGNFLPFFGFGAGLYNWYFTNSDKSFYDKSDIQRFRGEELKFLSIGLNLQAGIRYKLSSKFVVDGNFRYNFIQSKDNRGKFGDADKNEQSYDISLGIVYLFAK
jgi:outer membrane protein W